VAAKAALEAVRADVEAATAVPATMATVEGFEEATAEPAEQSGVEATWAVRAARLVAATSRCHR
jgi:hypothetical protein